MPSISPKKDLITYEYYLEGELQNEMPKNETTTDEEGNETQEVKYIYSRHQCTNNIIGAFDTSFWKFVPNENRAATCKIYFVKANYDIDITAANGIVDENNPKTIAREADGQFIVKPNEGYVFSQVTCSNDKKADYDLQLDILNWRNSKEVQRWY